MTITSTLRTLTELDRRENDGIEVALLWSRDDGKIFLSVTDYGTEETFTLEVAAADALDAFHHPFAYAAASGVQFGTGRREPVYA